MLHLMTEAQLTALAVRITQEAAALLSFDLPESFLADYQRRAALVTKEMARRGYSAAQYEAWLEQVKIRATGERQ